MIFGPQIGYHVLHAIAFLAVPSFVWWDISQENAEEGVFAAAFAFLLTAGYFATIGNSGDTNSLIGVFCASVAMAGSRAARLGRRWGAPVLMLGLTMGLYAHVAFCVYAGLFLLLEAAYYRDLAVVRRLAVAGFFAVSWRCRCTGSRCGTTPTSASTTPFTTRARRSTGRCSSAASGRTSRSSRCPSGGSTTTGASRTSGCRCCS